MKETEARHAISMSALPPAFAAYLQLTQRMESACCKQIRQSARREDQLIAELSSEPLQRRQLETECHSERRKRMGLSTPMSYKNRVYAWLTKQVSKGQKGADCVKYSDNHLEPFYHTKSSLQVFLRHHGVVRDAAAFNYLIPIFVSPSPPTNQQPFASKSVLVDLGAGLLGATEVCYDCQSITVSFPYFETSPQEATPSKWTIYEPPWTQCF